MKITRARHFAMVLTCLVIALSGIPATDAYGQPANEAVIQNQTVAANGSSRAAAKPAKLSFTFANVHRRAAALAAQPYQADRPDLPEYLKDLNYDRYRDIRFKPERSIWRGQSSPFELQMFSRGFLHLDRVTINLIENGEAKPLSYSASFFDFGANPVPAELPEDNVGFAGFRIHYPLNRDDYFDEVAVFLGASYFRAVGQKQNYGLSGRGLAIDTALSHPEEFPVFREFWIQKPKPEDTELTVFALLDSLRVTGAYRFVIKPGLQTVIDVKAHLFMRNKVEKIGIAPLTSMLLFGENSERYMNDFRPEVHDSDGLLIVSQSGERLWRPLTNPRDLAVNVFEVNELQAFGLLQRDREYDHYQDLEARYEDRPSVLVEPISGWGKGYVELVEIPSNADKYDNIGVYWRPEKLPEAGQELDFEYRLRFALEVEGRLLGGRAIATRIGAGGSDVPEYDKRRFVIDFAGPAFAELPPESPIEAVITTSAGKLINQVVQPNARTGGRRVFFELVPEGTKVVDLRCFLRSGDHVLTETWTYQWRAE